MAEEPSDNWLVEQRVAQLEEISQRRNVLLRQMYRMLQRKHDIGTLLPADDDDVDPDGVDAFLERFDFATHPETSSIVTLSQEELDVPIPTVEDPADDADPESDDLLALQPTEDPDVGAHDAQRTKPPPNPYRLRPAQPEDQDSDRDELDFLSTPPRSRHRTPSQPLVRSRSPSHPTSRSPPPGSPVAIDISDSSPPPPEVIDVDADEVEKREDSPMEVFEVDVQERDVSETHVQVTNADTPENEVVTEDIEEGTNPHVVQPSEMQPDDSPALQDVGRDTAQAQPLPPLLQPTTSPNNEAPDDVASTVAMPVENMAYHPGPAVVFAEGSSAGGPLVAEHQADHIQPPPTDVVAEPPALQTDITDTKDSHSNHEDVEMEDAPEAPTDPASVTVTSQPAPPVAADPSNVVLPTESRTAEVSPQVATISPATLFMPPIIERRRPPHILRGIRSPALENIGYVFEPPQDVDMETSDAPASDPTQYHTFDPHYTLPPLKSLPAEYQRKGKLTKAQRKREKEKREREKDGSVPKDVLSKEDNWTPLGLNRWAAVLNANPLYTKVSRATKCLLTKDWGTAFTELRLIKTFNHIENLKDAGRWSFRQPKKQRGVGGLQKTHWDYLMDEMKWMRTDFREERRWKLALAYNLSTAVLEWHAAGDTATRITNGICMKWRPPRSHDRVPEEEEDTGMIVDEGHPLPGFTEESAPGGDIDPPEDHDEDAQLKPMNPLSILNYNSDDDDDDDQDPDQGQEREQSVADALETSAMIDDALDAHDSGVPSVEMGANTIQPKTEEVDDPSALQNKDAMAVDSQDSPEQPVEQKPKDQSHETTPTGLKTDSANPTLMSATTSRSSDELSAANSAASKAMLKSIYAPIRERIAYSELDKLFLDFDDLDIARDETKDPAIDELDPLFPPSDLASVFPDFQPYGLFDVPSPIFTSDGKKKSEKKSDRDDPNKRAEDTTYSKLVPIGKFMHCKPTLLGPLQPSKKWKNGEWVRLDDYAISAEENPASKPVDIFSGLFGSNKPVGTQTIQLSKDRRATEIVWNSNEDALLKSLTERYPNNWSLIAECFNSARITLSTDKRTARDCLQRYDALLGPGSQASLDGTGVPMTPTTQMTTRGVKRLASVSAAGSSMIPNASEPRKRRRHALVHDAMRKLTRQRLATAQKNAMAQRKPLVVHDTHTEYNKLPKMSPAELGRLKAEKEARLNADQAIVKRKQEELRLQQMQRMQMATANGQQAAVPHQQQVGIAQHQRISTPVSANSRLSPQQVAQAQAHLQQRNILQTQQTQPIPTPQVPAQVSQVAVQGQPAIQAPTQNGVQAANGAGTPPQLPQNGTAATTHATYVSPPRNAGTPVNSVSSATSPRPPSAQAQAALLHATQMQQAVQMHQQATARTGSNIAYYMTPSGTPYTAEQINAMRVQLMQHQAVVQAQAQAQQQQQGAGQGS